MKPLIPVLAAAAAGALALPSAASAAESLDLPVAGQPGMHDQMQPARHHQVHRQLVRRYEGEAGERRRAWTNARLRREIREHRAEQRRERGYARAGVPSVLQSIAACESGGNPQAIGGGGLYRGKYQFDLGTWASVGGSGDPAAASEAEQDYRAGLLYARAGASPWPVCGG
jgi:hypothetical protein